MSTHATTSFSPSRSARWLGRALAACGRLRSLTAALRLRDVDGEYRPARADVVPYRALRVLSQRARRGAAMSAPQAVTDCLRVAIGVLEHGVFCVLFLDAQHRIIELKQMMHGPVTQTSVDPREGVKEALAVTAAAAARAHNHPSGSVESSRADGFLTQTPKTALALVDVRVIDHRLVAGADVCSFADRGLLQAAQGASAAALLHALRPD